MKLETTAEPAAEPLTLSEAKRHLRIDGPDDDAWLLATIQTVREYAEGRTNRSYIERTLKATWYEAEPRSNTIALPQGPVSAIEEVTDGNGQTVAAIAYELRRIGTTDYVYLDTLPASGLAITYTAGYGAAADVPAQAKHAMLMHLAHLYAYREAASERKTLVVELGLDAIYGQLYAGGLL